MFSFAYFDLISVFLIISSESNCSGHGTVAVAGRCGRCGLRGGGAAAVLLRAVPTELFVVRGLEGGHESGGRASRRKRVLRVMNDSTQVNPKIRGD
ncbi:hypothetical protein ANCCAN_15731 [Ancylostoma caninum]|uniref:Secreted protein n=1 Tax=Ancylostoma caninum TaxID=29170 RepID=A0A368G1U4_ANCCA|nr:hypothetical protein ANCCAN_15731 [Ancylostoma caninum]